MAGCPEALAWDDADIYTYFWCIWRVWRVSSHSANDWGLLVKKGVAADLAWQFNAHVVCFQLFACCFAPACMSLLMVT